MKLPTPGPVYREKDLTEMARQIQQADAKNLKSDRDIEIGQNRFILTSPNGSRYAVVVDNAGVLSTVPV